VLGESTADGTFLWAVLVGIGWMEAILNFVLWMHFLAPPFQIEALQPGRAIILIVGHLRYRLRFWLHPWLLVESDSQIEVLLRQQLGSEVIHTRTAIYDANSPNPLRGTIRDSGHLQTGLG
jgi:hypothetical protein